ncbi:alkaline phosphatase family protein [Natrinema sp. 1APR25-10V2]|uniref:alkaline phosphatase family protein n=1 Tax=Natrinema sp. 1APR25-10V2 TaxID=2951081 RepID=UPI0028759C98|nr:alkaline phosphatase family protein [Natrinema sp. 1APR25-10V2]MDS0475699.1 alkaline phosphatase family protein [Natrinema sp. 1APR25-10V2]
MTRTVVIGLDGANWDLIGPWLEQGDLPNVKTLLESGVHGESHSYIPPVTVPNWKCYSTGKNPGKLGVYRFDHLDVKEHEYVFHHSYDFDSAELWDYLNDEGYTTGVVNMPTTYPPREIDGFMICGGPDARQSEYRMLEDTYTHPESLQETLEEEYDYDIHPKPLISSNDERGEEVDAIHRLINLRFQVAYDLLEEKEVDFLHVTSFYSNTLQHFFWQEDPVYEAWQIFDEHIGRFLELEDTNVVMMSDHGCVDIDNLVYINNWLIENGYLALQTSVDDVLRNTGLTKERVLRIAKTFGLTDFLAKAVPDRIQTLVPWEEGVRGQRTFEKIDWDETVAVANTQGLVYLTVDRDDPQYDEFRAEIKGGLEGLKTPEGIPVVEQMHTYEELYDGDHLNKAPDLVAHQTDGIHMSEATGVDGIHHDTGRWEAENIPPGIFAATGPDITETGDLGQMKISDIAPTILGLMDCAVPTDMDGEPQPIFDGTLEERSPIPSPHGDTEAQEDDEVRERLEDLGYLN